MAAAYAALVSLSHVIQQILNPPPTHHFLIPREQMESLQEHVSSFINFLEINSTRRSQEIEGLEKRIVGAAHKAEDILESYVVAQIQAKYTTHPERKSSAPLLRSIQKELREVVTFQKVLKKKAVVEVINKFISIREELEEIRSKKVVENVRPAKSYFNRRNYDNYQRNGGLFLEELLSSTQTKVFRAQELAQVTDNYNVNQMIGKSRYGIIYKGVLAGGRIVAIKKSKNVKELDIEVVIGTIKHQNVVHLLGCCLETDVPLLIYEYINRGSLDQCVENFHGLSWVIRLRIAREVAGALAYMQSAASVPIYHCNLKSSNILLGDRYRAKIKNFGLSRDDVIDDMYGTGHIDPEYFSSRQFTEKSDVYSFGVVMVELLTGKSRSYGSFLASDFMDSMEKDQLFMILDATVLKEGKAEDIVAVARIARRCLHLEGRHRPTMKEVAVELEGVHIMKEQIMIGFDEHLKQIMAALAAYESSLQIIPIVGMGGIGKTTLALNVYKDAYIVQHFDVHAWVSISQEYVERDIIAALLKQINRNVEVNHVSADELGNLLHKELFGRRYFIILDDMWDIKAWDMLRRYFPNNSNGSRVLVTTRLVDLAEDFKSCTPYQLSLLNIDSSWALILEHAFGKEKCPIELEKIGKGIARKCGGLPLALVVIGGLLAKSEKTKEFWEYVEENVTSTANDENDEQCMKILRLSYNQLPVCALSKYNACTP